MARSQEAPRIPAPGLTVRKRLDGSSRQGGSRHEAGNSYRRLTCDNNLYHIVRCILEGGERERE